MKNTIDFKKQRREFHVFVASAYYDLARFKKEGNTTAFNALLLKTMPEVKRYIQKSLYAAMVNKQIDSGRYKSDDFVDQLFIEAYDHFDEVANKENLYLWLFKKANELLEDALLEEEFDSLFFENIDNYSKPEWDAMEEKFSTDGDADLVMMEELDDMSYPKNDYVLNPIFVEDDSKEFIAQLDRNLSAENIRKHANMVLRQLPVPMRKVFQLYNEHRFELKEIAIIQKCSVQEVETLLEAARKNLQATFFNRYQTGI